MKQAPVRLGPLALLLTVISLCLTILAILTFTTARADLRLAEKYADTVQARYALERQGHEYLFRLNTGSEAPPAADEDGLLRCDLGYGEYRLHIALRPDGEGGHTIVSWKQDRSWTPDESVDDLWDGQ